MVLDTSCANNNSVRSEVVELEVLESGGSQIRHIIFIAIEGHTNTFVTIGQVEDTVVEGLVASELSIELVGIIVFVDTDVGSNNGPGLEGAVEHH